MASSDITTEMGNRAMARKLKQHLCVDISQAPRTAGGDYLLARFFKNKDYCDAKSEAWIWSIARVTRPLPSVMADGTKRTIMPGEFLASTSSKFYGGADTLAGLTCVFLR